MFFENVGRIKDIAIGAGTSIFVVPSDIPVTIPGVLTLQPEDKATISIDQVRDVISLLQKKQLTDAFVVIRPADSLNLEAANALLKSLEEPQSRVHFVLITDMPSRLLPTILSRAFVYFLKTGEDAMKKIGADEKTVALAKKLIAAKPKELTCIADEVTRKKTDTRKYVLGILGAAIEILYKTYLLNQKAVFLDKIPKFLAAYDAISANGHIRLHLVADLI